MRVFFSQTRFRWYQSSYSSDFTWAIDNVYIGAACPNLCSGHGQCRSNATRTGLVCDCDAGFGGVDCQPTAPLATELLEPFENEASLKKNWASYEGGAIGTTCGVLASGNSLYFTRPGHRAAETKDMDVRTAT